MDEDWLLLMRRAVVSHVLCKLVGKYCEYTYSTSTAKNRLEGREYYWPNAVLVYYVSP